MLVDEYRRSLKLPEVEEIVDLLFYRPLGFLFAKAVYRTPLTPNQVTLLSTIAGCCAGLCFSIGTTNGMVWGGFLFLLANVLDCADGQLARLKKSGTLLGRIVDGVGDYVSGIAVFVGIGFGLMHDGVNMWWLVIATAVSTALHAVVFDRQQSEYVSMACGERSFHDRELEKFAGGIERIRAGARDGLKIAILNFYLRYLGFQQALGMSRETRSCDVNLLQKPWRKMIRCWSFVGPSTNRTLLVVCAFLGRLDVYLWLVVIAGNAWMVGCYLLQLMVVQRADNLAKVPNLRKVHRPDPLPLFRQSLKSDAFYADEPINIYLLRPLAGVMVWLLYPTSVTPNQVTVAAIGCGIAAAVAYSVNTSSAVAWAGVLILLKDILDDADGQLARAKQLYSRRGRFLDSIGDFIVDIAVVAAITYVVCQDHQSLPTIVLGILAFWGMTLRVSYHVYYQVSFLHLEDRYELNRIAEDITEADRWGDPLAFRLQQVFVVLYGWQDRWMARIDRWCRGKNVDERLLPTWYSDRLALRISGLLGFGTEISLLALCSWLNALPTYLWLNVLLMNAIWLAAVGYRKFVLAGNLK